MTRRIIGRILSMGFPLPGVRVDNYTLLSAPSFFDYDAVVADLAACATLLDEVAAGATTATTFAGQRISPLPDDDAVPLASILERRREEMRLFLARGGVAVLFARPQTAQAIHPPEQRLAWLPADVACRLSPPALVAADGTSVVVVDAMHAFAGFVLSQQANIAYRARMADDAPDLHVFARSVGGAAIAAAFVAGEGSVVLLPALRALPTGDARYAMSDLLQAAIRRALGATAEGREPAWAAAHDVPGLAEREGRAIAARAALSAAQGASQEAEAAREELARWRALLWQEGLGGLDDVVVDALRLVGFQVYAQDMQRIEIRDRDAGALIEIEGAEGPVGLAPHRRLRDRMESAIEQRGASPRGIVFANGRRLVAPAERGDGIAPELRTAAETMRYCVATTVRLFEAVTAALRGDGAAVAAYRRELLTTDGVLA
ncbi:MAG: hypothetical protein HYX50_01760 [Chloroflexi bacterium]|nr:hypothetical protein [Chloroflexota bacterium]